MELENGDMQACATAGGWQPTVGNFRRKYFSLRRYDPRCRKSLTGVLYERLTRISHNAERLACVAVVGASRS